MKKTVINIAILLLISISDTFGQSKFSADRVYFGGNLGASFGYFTFVDISPLVGYRFTERFTAGLGATYIYIKSNYYDYETSFYGGRIFSRYFITESIFAHAEQEVLRGKFYEPTNDFRLNSHTIGNTYIGGGYQSKIGMNSGVFILVLYNLNSSFYSKQINPSDPIVIRIGFNIGL